MPDAALTLQLVYLVGASLTVAKLVKTGLYRQYRVFTCYIGFSVFLSLLPMLLDTGSQFYLKVFVCTTPITWVFYVLVVRELFRLILARHKGIYTLGRWAMYVISAICVVVSFVSMLPRIHPAVPQVSALMPYIVAIERGVDVSLVMFILLILVFLTIYPVPLSRNLIVHVVVYSIFFLSGTLTIVLRALFGLRLIAEVNLFLTGASAACALAWLFLLTSQGEEVRVNLPWLPPQQESRLLTHLDSLNATLLKASRN
jgi:hypothetical protein